MKSALALVIGLNEYQNLTKLDNAVNDAKVISDALENLGFTVKRGLDVGIDELFNLVEQFYKELKDFDLGLFYFAGHGFQIEGENLLAGKEINTTTLSSAKRDSILLADLVKRMDRSNVLAKIIVLDACRKPIEGLMRGDSGNDFAPVFAPKGTLIAFSTSPGEGAKDGRGNNSYYTEAFVEHLKQENIEIELFFKRIRATVAAATSGAQTSWEHTSLIGPLVLNSGQLRHSKDMPYSDKVIADHEFKSLNSGSEIDLLLADLSGNFYRQNDALDAIGTKSHTLFSDDQLFLLGRGIINAGQNGSFSGQRILGNLKVWLTDFAKQRTKHVINGLLYEIYFDGHGIFRKSRIKSAFLKEVLHLQSDVRFQESFEMINEQLRAFSDRLVYIPGPETLNLPVDLTLDKQRDDNGRIRIAAINVHGKNITAINLHEEYPTKLVSKEEFLQMLSQELLVPWNKIVVSPALTEGRTLSIPYSFLTGRCTLNLFAESD